MTKDEILAEIDTRLAGRFGELSAAQDAYYAAHGRYAQGLDTHSTLPADGIEAAPDRSAAHPTDQAESWADLGSLPAAMLSRLRMDVYESPQGHGYVVVSEVRIAGELCRKALNVGPETSRAHGWQGVAELEA